MGGSFTGRIISGLGEGSYFMSLEHYKKEIKNKLGFDAFPGTLNILSENFSQDLLQEKIELSGFEKDGKKFGGADCYKASINKIKGALIFPHINKHKRQIEFISQENMREKLQLTDDDEVEVQLE